MNKRYFKLFWRSILLPTIGYLFLLGLIGLLVILYNLPTVFWGDVIRFSLPFFIVWLTGSRAIKYYRLRHLNISQLDKFTPTNMTEGKLVELLQDEQAKNIDTIRQLQATQHEQLDHLELFTHEIKNYLTSLNAPTVGEFSAAALRLVKSRLKTIISLIQLSTLHTAKIRLFTRALA